jgi:hypothetical protein
MGTYGYVSSQLLVDFKNTKKINLKCNKSFHYLKISHKHLIIFENDIVLENFL